MAVAVFSVLLCMCLVKLCAKYVRGRRQRTRCVVKPGEPCSSRCSDEWSEPDDEHANGRPEKVMMWMIMPQVAAGCTPWIVLTMIAGGFG